MSNEVVIMVSLENPYQFHHLSSYRHGDLIICFDLIFVVALCISGVRFYYLLPFKDLPECYLPVTS